jgi:serine/threonine-protein kinase
MPIDSLDGLLEELRKKKLLRPAQLDEVARILRPRCPSPLLLAKELVRRGWLTVYQINQLFQTNGQELVLGPFRILDHLGTGGVSQVFKAHHMERDCPVALKVIHAHLLDNPEAVGRFQREMKVVANLSHPNIVQSFADESLGKAHFFGMEFVVGTSLDRLIQLSGALPMEQACDFARQAALGLQHAHEKGLVHRDIKPANLLLTVGSGPWAVGGKETAGTGPTAEGQGAISSLPTARCPLPTVKIADFGLARLRRSPDENPTVLTVEGAMIGTPDYIAPEQARDARTADVRSDIYSLGCTLYHMLTGQPPFPGGTLMQKISSHIQKEPAAVEGLRSDVPPVLAQIVRKMMAKRPEDRHATPAEVAAALAPLCPTEDAAPTPA